jgi:hypothetical protein
MSRNKGVCLLRDRRKGHICFLRADLVSSKWDEWDGLAVPVHSLMMPAIVLPPREILKRTKRQHCLRYSGDPNPWTCERSDANRCHKSIKVVITLGSPSGECGGSDELLMEFSSSMALVDTAEKGRMWM